MFFSFLKLLSKENRYSNKELENYILSEFGVLIRCVQDFAIRITLGTHEENKLLIDGMKKFYKEQLASK